LRARSGDTGRGPAAAAPEEPGGPEPSSSLLRGLVPLMLVMGGLMLAFTAFGLGATGHGRLAALMATVGSVGVAGGLAGLVRS
jgi:hypothetical protein